MMRLSHLLLFILFIYLLLPSQVQAASSQLLKRPWVLSAKRNAAEAYQLIDPNVLKWHDTLRLTYNLRGFCLEGGDASAVVFDQLVGRSWWRYISLSKYGKNCYNGEQTVDIPLSHFPGLDRSKKVGTFHVRIWGRRPYNITISSALVFPKYDSQASSFGNLMINFPKPPTISPTPTSTITPSPTRRPTPTLLPTRTVQPKIYYNPPSSTPIPTLTPPPTLAPRPSAIISPVLNAYSSWSIQSVSSMKETKDRICNPRPAEFVNQWVNRAYELGANYVSIETPYDSPKCGDSLSYTRSWISAIRSTGMKVWHRHMPLAFEGIYNTTKNPSGNYLKVIAEYIHQNPQFFEEGDIFTPVPEPQNGGIYGVTYCSFNSCIFRNKEQFNVWLRTAMDISEESFAAIGLAGKIKIGYWGFDGFVTWGDNNPDWDGILEDATVLKMGNIAIDHYPELVGDTMENDLNELEARYPNIPIIIGEWGTVTPKNPEIQVQRTMNAARRPSVVGFNYWHMGVGGNEGLVRNDLSIREHFDEVARFYKNRL